MMVLDRLRGFMKPLLIICGREDRITLVSHAHGAEVHLPDAEMHVIPSCGHWSKLERSQEFNRLVLSFLSRVQEGKEATL